MLGGDPPWAGAAGDGPWLSPSLWDEQREAGRKARDAGLVIEIPAPHMSDTLTIGDAEADPAEPLSGQLWRDNLNTNTRRMSLDRPVVPTGCNSHLPEYPWPPRNTTRGTPKYDPFGTHHGEHRGGPQSLPSRSHHPAPLPRDSAGNDEMSTPRSHGQPSPPPPLSPPLSPPLPRPRELEVPEEVLLSLRMPPPRRQQPPPPNQASGYHGQLHGTGLLPFDALKEAGAHRVDSTGHTRHHHSSHAGASLLPSGALKELKEQLPPGRLGGLRGQQPGKRPVLMSMDASLEAGKRQMSVTDTNSYSQPHEHHHHDNHHYHHHRHIRESSVTKTQMEDAFRAKHGVRPKAAWGRSEVRPRHECKHLRGDGPGGPMAVTKVHRASFAPPSFMGADLKDFDQQHLQRIDEVTTGKRAGLHLGYAELSDFLRALRGGLAVHRIDMAGNSRMCHLSLAPSLDGLVFHHGPGYQMACTLPFTALRAVAAPFTSDEELGVLRHRHEDGSPTHPRTVVLVVALRATKGLPPNMAGLTAFEEAMNRGNRGRAIKVANVTKAALGVAELILADPEGRQAARHEQHDAADDGAEAFEIIKIKVPPGVNQGDEVTFALPGGAQIKVTIPLHARTGQLIPVKAPSSQIHAKASAAARGESFVRVNSSYAFYNLLGGLTAMEPLDGEGGASVSAAVKSALAAPRVRGYSLGVLVVTMAQMGARDRVLAGLPIAAEHIHSHIKVGRTRRGSVSYGLQKDDLKEARKTSRAVFSGRGKKMGLAGRLERLLSVLHHLYRPHYNHHSYIPARYALGTIAEVRARESRA